MWTGILAGKFDIVTGSKAVIIILGINIAKESGFTSPEIHRIKHNHENISSNNEIVWQLLHHLTDQQASRILVSNFFASLGLRRYGREAFQGVDQKTAFLVILRTICGRTAVQT